LSTLFLNRFEITTEPRHRDVLLVYSSINSLNGADFAKYVNEEIDDNLAPDEIMVVVRLPAFADAVATLRKPGDMAELLNRIRNKCTVIVCAFGPDGREKKRRVVEGRSKFRVLRIEDIVRRTITNIFERHKGYVVARGNYHFQIPSRRHTRRYIRFASILVETSEISFVALGALRYLNNKIDTAYVDTSQLFAFASAIGDHMRAFYPTRPPIIVENFKSYDGYKSFPFKSGPANFVFISASASGSLAEEIKRETGFNRPDQIVHLLYHGSTDPPFGVICDLAEHPLHNPEGYDVLPLLCCPLLSLHELFRPERFAGWWFRPRSGRA
jgi:hypothetical protein